MTAPQSRWNTPYLVDARPRPSTGALFVMTLVCAMNLPWVVPLGMSLVDGRIYQVALAAGIMFAIIDLFSMLVHVRAGGSLPSAAVTVKAMLASLILLSAGVGAAWVMRLTRREEIGYTTITLDIFVLLAIWALLTFVVVSLVLSSVRAAAHRPG